jgi:hypothetical protein
MRDFLFVCGLAWTASGVGWTRELAEHHRRMLAIERGPFLVFSWSQLSHSWRCVDLLVGRK